MFDPSRHVLHDDGEILVLDKWAGTPTSGRALDDPDAVQWHVVRWVGSFVWAVHQLDADTSGVLLFTRRKDLVAPLKDAMAHPDARKEYVAWIRGAPSWDAIGHAGPIGPLEHASGRSTLGVTPGGRDARTTFRVEARGLDAARVCARLHTGRTHQIRIHLADLGHPVLGDDWYGTDVIDRAPRQALHARRLTLGPPFGHTFQSPVPSDLAELSRNVGIEPVP